MKKYKVLTVILVLIASLAIAACSHKDSEETTTLEETTTEAAVTVIGIGTTEADETDSTQLDSEDTEDTVESGAVDSDKKATPTPIITPSITLGIVPNEEATTTTTTTSEESEYEIYAGTYTCYYDITSLYHSYAEQAGYEITNPDESVGVSFGLSLSADGGFSVWGNTSQAESVLEPLAGSEIHAAAASANASGSYTVDGGSITFYASDGRVVSGSITANSVSFTTPEPYQITLNLYR